MPEAAPISAVGGLPPGTRLGRYRIIRRLALGGMAELYLARHEAEAGFRKLVALKRVLPHLAEDAQFVQMFLEEARLAASLVHPNITQVTDFGSVGPEYFMVMEYVHGRSVQQLLRRAAPSKELSIEAALAIVTDVAKALHHAHEAHDADGRPLGLVHRDVSPSNILISFEGSVKLVDFGIAKATARSTGTRSNTLKGKLRYMAPEQARGASVDRRSDVFALGIVLYELTTLERCFFAEGEFALLNKVAQARFTRPSKSVEGYPPALEAIVLTALAEDPDERYPDCLALVRDVERFVHSMGLSQSSLLLADTMEALFGQQPPPSEEASLGGPLVTEVVAPAPSPPRARRAGLLVASVIAIAAVATTAWYVRAEEPRTATMSLPPVVTPPLEETPPAPVAAPVPMQLPAPEITPAAAEPPAPDPRPTRRKPKKHTKAPVTPPEFLPPSKR